MSEIDINYLQTWIGKSRVDDDVIAARHARLMAATVDYFATDRIRDGERLPPSWHWVYFLEGPPTTQLGRDGHPPRGGFCRRCRYPTGCGRRPSVDSRSDTDRLHGVQDLDYSESRPQARPFGGSGVRDRAPRTALVARRVAHSRGAGHRL
jgi:hypothetical protein